MSGLVHIGIVTYNSRDDLAACFAALNAQTYPHLAVTVLDNASQDDSAAWVEVSAPQAQVIRSTENLGFGRGHNRILATRPEAAYYMPLNPDVRLEPDYIGAVVRTLQENDAQWGTGKLLMEDGQHIYSVGHALRRDGYALNIGYDLLDSGQFEDAREVFGAPGAAPLYSRQLIDDLASDGNLFDPVMFMYAEDSDVDWRARRAGWRCWYTPAAVAYHRGSHARGLLRVQALGNRYLSVLKNAYLVDLLTYNIPILAVHCGLRLLLTPRDGLHLVQQLIQWSCNIWGKREKPRLKRRDMMVWFLWSRSQPCGQPQSWLGRISSFLQGRRAIIHPSSSHHN
ncbi:MAG: glycosyltransferase family 2 protein [Anaerolineae bacterium]|nr:glycosyltransferase family 2 protein [Anaerolineae bacterium]